MKNNIIYIPIKKILSSFRLVFFVSILFFISHFSPLISEAHAQEQKLKVSPVIINVTLSPGKTYNHEVAIENLSSSPLPLRATLSDFMTGGEEGGYIFEETRANPLLSWIELNETEFILNPKEKKTLQMTITTPQSIPVGGYYGVLFFEPVPQDDQTNVTKINSKIGVLMLANIGVADPNAKQAEILAFETNMFNTHGTVPLLLRVKNVALQFFSAKPLLTITPVIGWNGQVKEIELEEKIIFPGNVRRWTEENTIHDLAPNIYKAQIAVSTGNGQTMQDEHYFIVFPIMQAVIVSTIVIVLVFLLAKRKRLGKALQALIRS